MSAKKQSAPPIECVAHETTTNALRVPPSMGNAMPINPNAHMCKAHEQRGSGMNSAIHWRGECL